jgi:integrase
MLFNLGIDSKLRGCDLVGLRVRDVRHGDVVAARAVVMQQKTGRPVQFELIAQTRKTVSAWITEAHLVNDEYLFPSRIHEFTHLGTEQYARVVRARVDEIGLDPTAYGTHTMSGRKRH